MKIINSSGTGTVKSSGALTTSGTTSTGTSFFNSLYSTPKIIDTIINPDTIEVVYSRQYLVANNYGMPNPEIYKEVYSRTDGTMFTVQGTYIPYQNESYEF